MISFFDSILHKHVNVDSFIDQHAMMFVVLFLLIYSIFIFIILFCYIFYKKKRIKKRRSGRVYSKASKVKTGALKNTDVFIGSSNKTQIINTDEIRGNIKTFTAGKNSTKRIKLLEMIKDTSKREKARLIIRKRVNIQCRLISRIVKIYY